MKHLEVCQKYFAARRIVNALLSVSSGGKTLRLTLDILHLNPAQQKTCGELLENERHGQHSRPLDFVIAETEIRKAAAGKKKRIINQHFQSYSRYIDANILKNYLFNS